MTTPDATVQPLGQHIANNYYLTELQNFQETIVTVIYMIIINLFRNSVKYGVKI